MRTPPVHILILAAGASSRMRGADKLLEPVEGEPLLRRLARFAGETGQPVSVVLPPDRPLRAAALDGLEATRLVAEAARSGMAESLRAGLAAIPAGRPVLLLLGDLPELDGADLHRMLDAAARHPGMILRGAGESGEPGHPVLFPPWLRPDLMTLRGDEGARSLLLRHPDRLRLIPLPGRHALTDLDTPEDWTGWRAAQPSR